MNELKIVGWTNFECDFPSRNMSGSGQEIKKVVQLIGDEVVKHGYSISGKDHQNSSTGVPVFSDGTCLRASMRAWGQIMSAIYSSIEGINLSYMDFYMDAYKKTVLPEYREIKIEPGYVENELPGMIINEDVQLINSSLQMGMGLMTLDKVIKNYVEWVKKSNKA